MADDWSRGEVEVTVADHFAMLPLSSSDIRPSRT